MQLRPNTTVYDLSLKYNFNISLFERMVKNKLNYYQLKVTIYKNEIRYLMTSLLCTF
jgi:hypothetical protein